MFKENEDVISVALNEAGELEVVRRFKSNAVYPTHPPKPKPDRVMKDIFVVKDGKIVLDRTVEGKHTPAYSVPETFEFE